MSRFSLTAMVALAIAIAGCTTVPIMNVESAAVPAVGTLTLRSHTAVVEIPYSSTSYSIKHRSSVNLDEGGGNIHKNYNGWIQNLNKGISTQLGLL